MILKILVSILFVEILSYDSNALTVDTAVGEKGNSVQFRPGLHHGSASVGLEGGSGGTVASSAVPSPSSLPSAAEPPSHPVSLEVNSLPLFLIPVAFCQ